MGGVNFYSRSEIKDVMAYLKAIDNGADDLSVQRIINVPKRGIGAASIAKVQAFADANGESFYEALKAAPYNQALKTAAKKMSGFVDQIEGFKKEAEGRPFPRSSK